MPGSLSRVSPSPAPGGLTSSGRGGKETVSGGDEVLGSSMASGPHVPSRGASPPLGVASVAGLYSEPHSLSFSSAAGGLAAPRPWETSGAEPEVMMVMRL